ncbi:DUF4247 domain-containing protein [Parasphingorhabdus pacifica]
MKPKFMFLIAGIAGVLALIIAIVAISSFDSGPRGYVADRYERAAHLDLRGDSDNRAYTSPRPPQVVEREITAKFRPRSQFTEAASIYLRYEDDAVVIKPRSAGSVIHVLDDDEAYRRYGTIIGGRWGPIGGYGETFRGRGPGFGK